jgi:hypothetical protein
MKSPEELAREIINKDDIWNLKDDKLDWGVLEKHISQALTEERRITSAFEKRLCEAESEIARLNAENESLKRREAHLLDVYKSLGIVWGDDPFSVIESLKKRCNELNKGEIK